MYLTILILPLLGSLLATNRKCGMIGGPILSIFCIFITTVLSLIAFFEVAFSQSPISLKLGNWLDS